MYVVAEFSDLTVSSVLKKWETKIGNKKRIYFPKSGALAKIKAAVDVDKNSKKWSLHSYRLLMNGATFPTYEEARKAEIIAQNHSTMESFEQSYIKKRKARKRPKVNFETSSLSSSQSSDCSDFKKIRKLSKIDSKTHIHPEKEYCYVNATSKVNDWLMSEDTGTGTVMGERQSLNRDSDSDLKSSDDECISNDTSSKNSVAISTTNESSSEEESVECNAPSKKSVKTAKNCGSSSEDESAKSDTSSNKSDKTSTSKNSDSSIEDKSVKHSAYGGKSIQYSRKTGSFNCDSDEDVAHSDSLNGNSLKDDESDKTSTNDCARIDPSSNSIANYTIDENENINDSTPTDRCNASQLPLESTNLDQLDPIFDYSNFNVEKRVQYIERNLTKANDQLIENKKLLTGTMEALSDIKLHITGLTQAIKDLSVEVFDNKEELKKRNGLFTDLIAPQIAIPIKKISRYDDTELELRGPKIVDNLIKYLGSTINESNENGFIKACLSTIFTPKFLLNKVYWKRQNGKAFFKKSQLLHCIRESYKGKFGLIEPKKTDKQIDALIHKICTNIKDSMRKSIKSEKAKQSEFEDQSNVVNRKAEEIVLDERNKKPKKKKSNNEDDDDDDDGIKNKKKRTGKDARKSTKEQEEIMYQFEISETESVKGISGTAVGMDRMDGRKKKKKNVNMTEGVQQGEQELQGKKRKFDEHDDNIRTKKTKKSVESNLPDGLENAVRSSCKKKNRCWV